MSAADILLGFSLALGIIFGAVFSWRPDSLPKLVVKTDSTAFLTAWAVVAGAPPLLIAGLAFSTLGDLFLALRPKQRWLLPGMAAFFLAHAVYIDLFWSMPTAGRSLLIVLAQGVLIFGGAFFVRWLSPWLGKMRWPVFAYAIIILIMGAAALRLHPSYLAVTAGAMMFIASDVILSLELFTRPESAPARKIPSIALWYLYYGGQVLIAWGIINPLV